MKVFYLLFALALLIATATHAQLRINTTSVVRAHGVITTNTSINNTSTQTNLSSTTLNLLGGAQQITTAQPLVVQNLTANEAGIKTLSGNWEVTNALQLNRGIITIGNGAKLLYSGSAQAEGNENSYINGFLYVRGDGQKTFPIGTSTFFAPAIINDVPAGTLEVGMRVVAGDVRFALQPEIQGALTSHYWELSNIVSSTVSLSTNNTTAFLASGVPVVLQGSSIGGNGTSLAGNTTGNFITSIENATQPLLTIGKEAEFVLTIRDLITPFVQDDVNDRLVIENINLAPDNKVTLVDRWGVVAAQWNNYSNETEYDFSKLSPGNYVCLVEFTYPGDTKRNKTAGLVTVLKGK